MPTFYKQSQYDQITFNGEKWNDLRISADDANTGLKYWLTKYNNDDGFITTGLSTFKELPTYIWMDNRLDKDDFFITQGQDDKVRSGGGDDTVSTERGDDDISGGNGHDFLLAGGGADIVYGGSGDDTLRGDSSYMYEGKFAGYSQPGNAFLASRAGGYSQSESMQNKGVFREDEAHAGDDVLYGGAGDDKIFGEGGHDTLEGGTGDDLLDGGFGGDWMDGGAGDDILISGGRDGGYNRDVMIGGAGSDTFFLTNTRTQEVTQDTTNIIEDFLESSAGAIAKGVLQKAAGAAGTAVGGPVAGFVADKVAGEVFNTGAAAWQSYKAIAKDGDDNNVSVSQVVDFNPIEDILVLPKGDFNGFAFTYEVERTSAPSDVEGRSGTEYSLKVSYGPIGNQEAFAEIFLAPEFLEQMEAESGGLYTASANGYAAKTILEQLVQNALELDKDGFSNAFDKTGTLIDANTGEAGVQLMGAVGSLVNTNPDIAPDSAMIGTKFDDVLGGNRGWVTPGDEGEVNTSVISTIGTKIWGFDGDDLIQGTATSDVLVGGAGDDTIYTMGAGGGTDAVLAGRGQDTVFAGADFGGGNTRDLLDADGGHGHDTMSFQHASNGIELTHDGDRVEGIDGNDTTGNTQYILDAFEAFDGSDHRDHFDFRKADEDLELNGGKARDVIQGGRGDDQIDGGAHNDKLTGGQGADTFVFMDGHGRDTVTDFRAGQDDAVDLSEITAITGFNDLMRNHISFNNGDAIIDTGPGEIVMEDVSRNMLDSDSFIF